jgi:hypothetical protein
MWLGGSAGTRRVSRAIAVAAQLLQLRAQQLAAA